MQISLKAVKTLSHARQKSMPAFQSRTRDSTPWSGELRADFALLLLPNPPRLNRRVSGLVQCDTDSISPTYLIFDVLEVTQLFSISWIVFGSRVTSDSFCCVFVLDQSAKQNDENDL